MGKLRVGAEAKVPIVLIIDCETDLFKLRLPVFWDGQDGYGVLVWIFIQTDGDMFIVPGVIFWHKRLQCCDFYRLYKNACVVFDAGFACVTE